MNTTKSYVLCITLSLVHFTASTMSLVLYVYWLTQTNVTKKVDYYLGVVIDMVISSKLHDLLVVDDASWWLTLRLKYAGRLGSHSFIVSLFSIATTSNMVGRSAAFSCTHRSAMITHLVISAGWLCGINDASIRSVHLSSSHNCHACLKFPEMRTCNKQHGLNATLGNLRIPGDWWNLHID
jgi:hypothetical protein